MNKEEIYNYNNRCAEFLGYVNTTPTDKDFNIYENEKGMIIDNKIYTLLETMSMKFHSDWNWIMEVVEAIEELDIVVLIGKNTCVIEQPYGKTNLDLKSIKRDSKQEAVVEAINQFLKHYEQFN